ncbi:MAG TPA: Omp28-related outer membrane protein [Chitinophagaceae bacterium]|nr:Omp28-related outer membrane protein [Chitinophagaceae bacterium]HNF71031.1 Omp28-related outer membrane protein [Chitinophagaceae bacterium]
MNNYFFGFAVLMAAFVSCTKEQIPPGLILHDPIQTVDTTYMTGTIPAAQTKRILMEEPTGVRCPNCPEGAVLLHDLITTHPGRILSASVYSPFLNEFKTPAKYNFNTTDAEDLVNFLGGDPSKPTASIDRIPTNYVTPPLPYFFQKADWPTIVAAELLKTTPVNLELQVIPNGSDYYLKTKLTFTDTITSGLAISVYILEDGVVDVQEFPSSVIDTAYVHNHILRKMVTPVSGMNFLDSIATKEKGRVFERTFPISIPSNVLNKSNCSLLCFVHRTGSSKTVLQVDEIKL